MWMWCSFSSTVYFLIWFWMSSDFHTFHFLTIHFHSFFSLWIYIFLNFYHITWSLWGLYFPFSRVRTLADPNWLIVGRYEHVWSLLKIIKLFLQWNVIFEIFKKVNVINKGCMLSWSFSNKYGIIVELKKIIVQLIWKTFIDLSTLLKYFRYYNLIRRTTAM